jgi:hypothetical protein
MGNQSDKPPAGGHPSGGPPPEQKLTRDEMRQYLLANYETLLTFARCLIGNREDALDVVHDAVIKLLVHYDLVEARRVAQYCFTTLRNAVYDHWRVVQRRRCGLSAWEPAQLPSAPALEGEELLEVALQCVRVAYEGLCPGARKAFSAWWKTCDRQKAFKILGLAAADKNARGLVYDRPLCEAKKALRQALKPLRDVCWELAAEPFWLRVLELVSCDSPDAPIK